MPRSRAEHLDRAVSALLGGSPFPLAGIPDAENADLPVLVAVAAAVQRGLAPAVPSATFEERLADRLVNGRALDRALRAMRRPEVVLTGAAVSSAALGIGLTAIALWRSRSRTALSTRLGLR